ncbi:petJ [Symbiodinium sp. CCMP2592]|nr:petJ [Symbiodinium sp. CCMP2592]
MAPRRMASPGMASLLLLVLFGRSEAFEVPRGSAAAAAGPVSQLRPAEASWQGAGGAEMVETAEEIPPPSVPDGTVLKASLRPLLLSLLLGLSAGLALSKPESALAADLENGQGIFLANCAACHAGGNNAVQPDKKLKKEALETYGMFDVERIKYQVTNGKNAMPAFGERLGPEDIEDVANYVIDQANKGWS